MTEILRYIECEALSGNKQRWIETSAVFYHSKFVSEQERIFYI